MSVSRRTLLKSGAALGAASMATAPVRAAGARPDLIVFDSRIAASRAFAAGQRSAMIDLAHQDAEFWTTLRSAQPAGRIVGLTRWSDWVLVRGMLEDKGKRLRSERRSGQLFAWEMG